jgi:hypothetical protein
MRVRALNQLTKMVEGRSGGLFRPLAARLSTIGQAAHALEAPSPASTGLHTLEMRHKGFTLFICRTYAGCKVCLADLLQRVDKGFCTACHLSISILLYTKFVETVGNPTVELLMMAITHVQELQLDSSFKRDSPADSEKANSLRQVIPMLWSPYQ